MNDARANQHKIIKSIIHTYTQFIHIITRSLFIPHTYRSTTTAVAPLSPLRFPESTT